MKTRSLSASISAAACSIVCILLLVSLAVSEHFKKNHDRIIEQRYLQNIHDTSAAREKQEKTSLYENICFNTQILSLITAKYLYDFDIDELKNILSAYMHYPEIRAIAVFNEQDNPVAAMWKEPDIKQDTGLPGKFDKDDPLSVFSELLINREKIGYLQIWYSENKLKKNILTARQKLLAEAEKFQKESEKQHKNFIMWQRIGVLFIILSLTICLMVLIRILVLKPLGILSEAVTSLSKLDLTCQIQFKRKDEIGRLLSSINNMISILKEIVSSVHGITGNLNLSSVKIMNAIKGQAVAETSLSASVSEISSAMTKLTSSSDEIAEHSALVAEIAEGALINSKEGTGFVKKVLNKMDEIHDDNQKTIAELTTLSKRSEDISEIMNLINNISDQTKIVAFNAAIEASAAGDSGKRFGVVASEIRRLAVSITDSTENIENKLNEITSSVYNLMSSSQNSSTLIQEGVQYSHQTSLKLKEIVNRIRAAAEASIEISSSTQQQSAAEKQINAELLEIKNSASQTLDAVKHISLISSDLTDMSAGLNQIMNEFNLDK
ncbi:Methyl-accepting chemotaxis signailing-domain-containing protein, HAMP domain-containing [Desulfonema limicola]|uniref:Methyl-accepting chemotaxis signailing-domain-containing protein, HAMP domain-containing n=1 Tax=Desulfonema limicola TaxID=45656 RepID=A0A975GG89_9BACT|nr:methyl-accepting chemotaxis protein [Desulfonema limicola]QTA80036.1 Methyl-accepting chemotaxis signailing-domain-containing protein, HAMP domain-containing [Desulfonema limicola]